MIRYSLKCDQDHCFDSWFQSAEAYETLKAAGHLTCAVCGSTSVEKALMAPLVSTDKARKITPPPAEIEAAIKKMRKSVEDNATYVGGNFVKEARAQHLGDVPDRPIWGEAKPEDAKSLIEDGIPVAPLPFVPKSKTN